MPLDPKLAAALTQGITDSNILAKLLKMAEDPVIARKMSAAGLGGGPLAHIASRAGGPVISRVATSIGGRMESKKLQIKNLIKEAIALHEAQKTINEAVGQFILYEMKIRTLCDRLLKEGPLAGAFGAPGAASAFNPGNAAMGQAQAMQQPQQLDSEKMRIKNATKRVDEAIRQVEAAQSKFSQEQLARAQTINAYHDAVVRLHHVFSSSVAEVPDLQQKAQDIAIIVSKLEQDLVSERNQVDKFIASLKKGGGNGPNVQVAKEQGKKQGKK